MKRNRLTVRIAVLLCVLLLSMLSFAACSDGEDSDIHKHKVWTLEIYLYETTENHFHCAILPGSDDRKSLTQIYSLWNDAVSVEEAKNILQEYTFEDENVCIVYFQHPLSSFVRPEDDTFSEQVSALFDNRFSVVPLGEVCNTDE